jgi:hypothetical protein
LQSHVGLTKENLFNTEVIVWGEIPAAALVCDWSWELLEDSGLFELFPGLLMDGEPGKSRGLQFLRNNLASPADTFSFSELAHFLINGLDMPLSTFFTYQMGLIMIGWAKGYSKSERYCSLQRTLEREFSGGLAVLRRELYKKDMKIGRGEKEEIMKLLNKSQDDSFFGQSLVQWMEQSSEPTISGWLRKRAESYFKDRETYLASESEEYGFLEFLKEARSVESKLDSSPTGSRAGRVISTCRTSFL